MRKMIIVCMLFLTAGCAALQPVQQSATSQEDPFQKSLEQLLRDNNSGPMNAFIKEYPDSIFIADAKRLLKLHSSSKQCRNKLKTCDTQLTSSNQELIKLQEDIERLTQLNLDMDRSSP